MIRVIVLFALALVIAVPFVAVKLFGGWAAIVAPVLILGAIVLGFKLFGERALGALLEMPFKAKGAALREATVDVHGLAASPEPITPPRGSDAEEDEEEAQERAPATALRYYVLDATIRPAAPNGGPFQHWEPSSLVLVPPGTDPEADDDELCKVLRVEVEEEGAFQLDEGWKVTGPRRIRLGIGVQPAVRELAFRYYFESFGRLVLPR